MSFECAVSTETERARVTLKWFIIAVDFFAMDDILGITWKFSLQNWHSVGFSFVILFDSF
jgi:hypothetical protein